MDCATYVSMIQKHSIGKVTQELKLLHNCIDIIVAHAHLITRTVTCTFSI